MALQDLTPQLRTRLSRMERAVGWFVLLATALLVFGFGYYIYNTANRKGWFIPRAPYFTFTERATGLRVGDPVLLMGFEVGQITLIDTMDPWSQFNVYVEFTIKEPYNGYIWTGNKGSRAKVVTADFLGKRVLEVTKGLDGYPAYRFHPLQEIGVADAQVAIKPEHWEFAQEYDKNIEGSNVVVVRALQPVNKANLDKLAPLGLKTIRVLDTTIKRKYPTVVWSDQDGRYVDFVPKDIPQEKVQNNRYWLVADETPAVTDRLEGLVGQIEKALPNVLALTNQLTAVLSNSANLTSNLNAFAMDARPAGSNLSYITAQLREPGALGVWVLGTNGSQKVDSVLGSASSAVATADTNLTALFENVGRSLDNLADITSNLNAQVQANTNMLGSISKAVVDADDLVQGLKRHWLLRSAFKASKTNAPSSKAPKSSTSPPERVTSPRDSTR